MGDRTPSPKLMILGRRSLITRPTLAYFLKLLTLTKTTTWAHDLQGLRATRKGRRSLPVTQTFNHSTLTISIPAAAPKTTRPTMLTWALPLPMNSSHSPATLNPILNWMKISSLPPLLSPMVVSEGKYSIILGKKSVIKTRFILKNT